jgi:hypothetical protein
MAKKLLWVAFICFSLTVVHPVSAHPGSAIVIDAKGQVYFVDTGHGVWMVNTAGKLVDLGGPAFHWMTLDSDSRFTRLRAQGGSFEFVAKPISGGTLILSSDFPIALGNELLYFAPDQKTPPLRAMRLTRDGRSEPAAVIETRVHSVNGLAHGQDGFYFTQDAAVKKLMSNGSVSVIADKVMPAECSADRVRRQRVCCGNRLPRRGAHRSARHGYHHPARRKPLGSHSRGPARQCGLRARVPTHAWRRSTTVATSREKGRRQRPGEHYCDRESSDSMSLGCLQNVRVKIEVGVRPPASARPRSSARS